MSKVSTIIEEVVVPLYESIFNFEYMDMEPSELSEFISALEIDKFSLESKIEQLLLSEEIQNWRIRIVICWLSVLFGFYEVKKHISKFLLEQESSVGREVYIYCLYEFNDYTTLTEFLKNMESKKTNYQDDLSDITFAKAALQAIDSVKSSNLHNHNVLYLHSLSEKLKEIRSIV